jgi:hypothetical protein
MGILIEPENEAALINAIENALTIDPATKKYNARAFAEENLSMNEVLSTFAISVLDNNKKMMQETILREKVALS